MKKDVYWFKHDSGIGREIEMRKMAHFYGHWGKGIYWDVLEILREQPSYCFKSDDASLQFLAEIIGCKDTVKFTNWFKECVTDGIFYTEESMFYSPRLTENMKVWDAKKVAGGQGGRAKALANVKQTSSRQPSKPLADSLANVKQNSGNNSIVQNNTEDNKTIHGQFIDGFNLITKKMFRGNTKTQTQLKTRLTEKYTLEQILRAVQNCFNDPYHKEHTHYLTPEFILRTDKLEKYLNAKVIIQVIEEVREAPKKDFFKVDYNPNA